MQMVRLRRMTIATCNWSEVQTNPAFREPDTQAMSGAFATLVSGLGTILKGLGVVMRDVAWGAVHLYGTHQKVIEAGWFPSTLLPYQKLAAFAFNAGFSVDDYLRKYFEENFEIFEAEFKQRIEHRAPDAHSKVLLAQALAAHKEGLYFCVPPAIFAEIERAVRLYLKCEGGIGSRKIKELFREMTNTNLENLIAVGPVVLTDIITEHVYKDTRGISEPEIKFLNRHQVMHGFKVSSGFKDSLNALLLAEGVISFLAWKSSVASAQSTSPTPQGS